MSLGHRAYANRSRAAKQALTSRCHPHRRAGRRYGDVRRRT